VQLNKLFQGSKVLITGGLGFIGSNLAHVLVELKAEVSIVDSLTPEGGGNLYNIDDIKNKVKVSISDIRDESAMACQVEEQDYIFNLAAQLSHVDSMKAPFTDLDINCKGHLVLLEACRKHNNHVKIIYTGTRAQYGRILYTPVDEKHPLNPIDTNGITKHAAEQYHMLYHKVYGIRAASLRLTNTYGPRHQMKHSRQGFIGWFVRLAMDDQTIKIFGDGAQIRDTNYVDDVVSALLVTAASEKGEGEVFNLGGSPISNLDLAKLIIKIVGKGRYELVPYPEESKRIEIGDYTANITKIRSLLGWQPTIDLEEGLERMVRFYERNRAAYW
jgi:UDP-glucose 4-epimerase